MSRESISIVEGGHKFQDGSILNSSTRTIIVELQKTFIGVLLEVEQRTEWFPTLPKTNVAKFSLDTAISPSTLTPQSNQVSSVQKELLIVIFIRPFIPPPSHFLLQLPSTL